MFDLEAAIADWRRQMSRAGLKVSQLTELDSHLREHVQEQVVRGVTAEQAFVVAAKSLGDPHSLAREYSRARRESSRWQGLMLTVALVAVAFVLFLGGAAAFLCYTQPVDRLLVAAAVLCTVAVAFNWRLLLPLLPAIPRTRQRLVMMAGAMGLCFSVATLYCQVIAHHVAAPGEGLLPALGYFAMVPVALGFCCVIAFEVAAQSRKTA